MAVHLVPLFALFLSALSTAIIMPYLLNVCYRRGLFDLPNERKVHKHSIPRLGGMVFVPAMIISFFGTIALLHALGKDTPDTMNYSSLFMGGCAILIYFIGVIDDLVGCKAKTKFATQLATAVTFSLCGLRIDSLYGFLGIEQLPLLVSYMLTIFLTLLIINAINLIDGIDGLAAGISLVALATYAYLFSKLNVPTFVILIASLSGAILVFLPFNLWGAVEKRRKTFMGDSGSLLLGVVLSYFTMKYAMSNSTTLPLHSDGLLMAYSTVLVPCFDLCRVALCRLKRGQGIFHPDKTHLHHKFMAAGFSMHKTLVYIIALQLAYLAVNVILFRYHIDMVWIMLLDVITFTAINIYLPIQKK